MTSTRICDHEAVATKSDKTARKQRFLFRIILSDLCLTTCFTVVNATDRQNLAPARQIIRSTLAAGVGAITRLVRPGTAYIDPSATTAHVVAVTISSNAVTIVNNAVTIVEKS